MNGITTLTVVVWLLMGATLLFYWFLVIRPLNKNYNNLLMEIKNQKEENDKLFQLITESFEFLSIERTKIIKDIDELKRRVRMYGNEAKRKIISRKDRG
jgi:heme exporter protein D